MLYSYKLASTIDFAASDGAFAIEAARKRIPYLGFCLTEAHATKLRRHIIHKLMLDMCKESDSNHDPNLAKLLKMDAMPKKQAT